MRGNAAALSVALREVKGAFVLARPSIARPKYALRAHPPSYSETSSPSARCRFGILVAELRTCFTCLNGRAPQASKTRRADYLMTPSFPANSRLGTCDVLLFCAAAFRALLQVCAMAFFFFWHQVGGL